LVTLGAIDLKEFKSSVPDDLKNMYEVEADATMVGFFDKLQDQDYLMGLFD